MTVSDEPTTPLQRPPAPRTSPEVAGGKAPARRAGALRTTRDVLACIYYALASIIMILLLYFGGAFINALNDAGDELGVPDVGSTECIGEVPCD